MTGTRHRIDRPSRLDWWRRQVQRQQRRNLTIADFCRQLGVIVLMFYYWKRRVREVFFQRTSGLPREHLDVRCGITYLISKSSRATGRGRGDSISGILAPGEDATRSRPKADGNGPP
jgi:hypothetical protein